jgi:hypothetical protein
VFRQTEKTEITSSKIHWRWGFVSAFVLVLIALFPQIYFIVNRGHQWNGANAITHPDEVAYSAYVASLIRGNPRRNDPFTARTRVAESLFSIQFVPAYTVAAPPRVLGLSASTTFIILPAVCAFLVSLALFWFFSLITEDERFSAATVLVVLGFGTAIAGQGIVRYIPNLSYLIPVWISNHVSPVSMYGLPFLRLYQPAIALPLIFVFCGLVWSALTRTSQWSAIVASIGAALILALLIFSYFYLWTTAAAWLVCICVLWFIARSAERKRTMVVLAVVVVFACAALVPYLSMLSRRAVTIDAAQALTFTHRPDLFRLPEVLAAIVLAMIAFLVRRRLLHWEQPVLLMAISLAITVFIVFNQQVITGRSLQPIHYEWFIANYLALVAVALTAFVWWRSETRQKLTNKRLVLISMLVVVWAFGEAWLAASIAFDYNLSVDKAKPVLNRLAADPNGIALFDVRLADRLPTDAPQAVLWAPRMLVFPGVSESENFERFWKQLYYLGYDEKKFWAEVDRSGWNFLTGMFPYQRLSPAVSGNQSAITPEELRARLASYLEYAHTFNRDRASTPALSFVIVRADDEADFTNLDRWYRRDEGQRVGDFILYRVKLRD